MDAPLQPDPAIEDIQAVSVPMLPADALLAAMWVIFKSLRLRTLFWAPSGCSLAGELLLARSRKPVGCQSDECQGQPTGTLQSVELTLNASMGTKVGEVSARLRSLLQSSEVCLYMLKPFSVRVAFQQERQKEQKCLHEAFPGFLSFSPSFPAGLQRMGIVYPYF